MTDILPFPSPGKSENNVRVLLYRFGVKPCGASPKIKTICGHSKWTHECVVVLFGTKKGGSAPVARYVHNEYRNEKDVCTACSWGKKLTHACVCVRCGSLILVGEEAYLLTSEVKAILCAKHKCAGYAIEHGATPGAWQNYGFAPSSTIR